MTADIAELGEPVWDARSLTSTPVEFELIGPPSALDYPELCARCAAPASRRLLIERVFERRRKNARWEYVVAGARVPFCEGCIAQHDCERPPISFLRRLLLCFRAGAIIPVVTSGALAIFFASEALGAIGEDNAIAVAALTAFSSFLALIAAICLRVAWEKSRRFAVPEPSSVTAAFDFSDDLSELFDSERRRYRLANMPFAKALDRMNRGRIWDAASRVAKRAHRMRTVLAVVFVVACLVVWLRNLFQF